ncbi:phage tail domain-containing protein [Thalassobacillus sp. CUG 92003]|uniref:phage tail domain-containing protein n=1 Tax=Thalassobacillus sp. CUG 92003 TaxID=2736641 RepID=UPI0015E680B8|nr:phage tail domain-containing protein [Thalassobacillus sp. CUG 92003]
MSGFSIDGVHFTDDLGIIHREGSAHPISPGFRSSTVEIPGRPGVYDFGGRPDVREFELACMIPRNETLYGVQEKAREIARVLLDDYGRPKTARLIYDYEPDKFYNVRLVNGVSLERVVKAGEFTLPLTAHDPWAYSVRDNSDGVPTWGSDDVTFEYHYLLGNEETGDNTFTITADKVIEAKIRGYAVRPIFDINGSAGDAHFQLNGKQFDLPSFSNESWTIDGERYTVKHNGQNGMPDFSGEFLELLPGDNEIHIWGYGMNFDLTVKFRDRFM